MEVAGLPGTPREGWVEALGLVGSEGGWVEHGMKAEEMTVNEYRNDEHSMSG